MKSPITIPCSCGKQIGLEVTGSRLPDHAKCSDCDSTIYLMDPLGNVATMLLIARAKQELANSDVTVCTLMSAAAVETEMAYQFFKWKGIDSGKLPNEQTPQDREQWENEWANMRSVGNRLEKLCVLLTKKPFDEFARLKINLLKPALAGHDPASSIKDSFQDQLFEKRNDIVHYGEIDFEKPVGERSLLSATTLLNLLHAMDETRYDLTFPKK